MKKTILMCTLALFTASAATSVEAAPAGYKGQPQIIKQQPKKQGYSKKPAKQPTYSKKPAYGYHPKPHYPHHPQPQPVVYHHSHSSNTAGAVVAGAVLGLFVAAAVGM